MAYKHISEEYQSFDYLSLLQTYVRLGVEYWLEMASDYGRLRLVDTCTGEYMIYGDQTRFFDEKVDAFGKDERLYMNMPAGSIRVRVQENPPVFTIVSIQDDLMYRAIVNRWCLLFTKNGQGVITYEFTRFDHGLVSRIRTLQYAALEDAPMHERALEASISGVDS